MPDIGFIQPTPLMNHLPLSPRPITDHLPLISPLPESFPLGYFGTYATMYNNMMLACSPGVTIGKYLHCV